MSEQPASHTVSQSELKEKEAAAAREATPVVLKMAAVFLEGTAVVEEPLQMPVVAAELPEAQVDPEAVIEYWTGSKLSILLCCLVVVVFSLPQPFLVELGEAA